MSQRECYVNSIRTIDEMGEFIQMHKQKKATVFGGIGPDGLENRREIASQILPLLRGVVSSNQRVIGHYTDHPDALTFAGSKWASQLGALGTSCPDHFLRTRVCPMFLAWNPRQGVGELKQLIQKTIGGYRVDYKKYYDAHASKDSPKLRDTNPSVVIVPGLGLFGFGRS